MSEINLRIQNKHDTTERWEAIENIFVPLAGEIIIYDDTPPKMKIGDGITPLMSLPFLASDISALTNTVNTHIENNTIHITNEEKIKWNNKVSCEIVDQETAKFSV